MWVCQRRRFGDYWMSQRLLISRRGTDENVLPTFVAKQVEIAFNIWLTVGNPVDDDIKVLVAQDVLNLLRLSDVGQQCLRTLDDHGLASSVEQVQVKAALYRQIAHRYTDIARAANKQDFHGNFP